MSNPNIIYNAVGRFMALFQGLDQAFGTGEGRWIKRPPTMADFVRHLLGQGPGIGIAPLRPDNMVLFAAIDLDEPDFDAAREMQEFLPGVSWLERSRSGNAHVWVFFCDPIEAWIPMGVMKEATLAADKPHVEIFPKNHDFSRVKLGNYINLPFHGEERPIVSSSIDADAEPPTLHQFIREAEELRNDPEKWRRTAQWLMISAPEERPNRTEFGTQRSLHICAEHILSGDAGPITPGHRSVVYFSLAKMLTNWEQCDHDEAWELLQSVNEASAPDSIPDSELRRILSNAERGQFTSTGCDDPLFLPFAHPDCTIAHPRRA